MKKHLSNIEGTKEKIRQVLYPSHSSNCFGAVAVGSPTREQCFCGAYNTNDKDIDRLAILFESEIDTAKQQGREEVVEEIRDKVIGLTKEKHDDVWVVSYDQVIELLDKLHSQTKEKKIKGIIANYNPNNY